MRLSLGARIAHLSVAILVCLPDARATDIQVIALTTGKATLIVDRGRPRTLSAGQTSPEGVRLVSASPSAAVVESNGQRRTLTLGMSYSIGGGNGVGQGSPVGRSVSIAADRQGHFVATGSLNDRATVRFLVDTGASVVSISADDAKRAGIDYLSGQQAYTQTAAGPTRVYRVKLDSVRLGEVVVYNVDAAVHTGGGLPIALLGMSFLNRMEMRRDAGTLTITRRY